MFKLTIVVGVLALLAVGVPDLTLIALFLIVPGLILVCAPTAFIYLATATAIRFFLPNPTSMRATWTAILAAITAGWLVVWPFQILDYHEYLATIKEEITPAEPIQLKGHIRLERGDAIHLTNDSEILCDDLCAALLLAPEVKSVTIVKGQDVTNWRLVPKESIAETGLAPTAPGSIFSRYPGENIPAAMNSFEFTQMNSHALEAEWNLKLATRETLVVSDTIPESDMTIAITDIQSDDQPEIQRVEVISKDGATLFRRSLIQHRIVQAPLHICLGESRKTLFEIAHRKISTRDPYYLYGLYNPYNPTTELIRHGFVPCHMPSKDAPQQVELLLVAALNKSDATPQELGLAIPWMGRLDVKNLSDQDAAIVYQIVSDLRIPDAGRALRGVYARTAPVEFRSVLVQRILAPETNAKDRDFYASLLASMPAGTFADMTEHEWQIIRQPSIWKEAAPFIERLADSGQPGTEPLIAILKQTVDTIPELHLRMPIMKALRRGLTTLGTEAAAALPLVKTLIEQEPFSPLTDSNADEIHWRVAMVRMGLAVNDLPFPAIWTKQRVARMQDTIISAMALDRDTDKRQRASESSGQARCNGIGRPPESRT